MILGVIGGLGPMATAYFLELIIKMTDANCDSEHLEMIIHNCPSIPDRTNFILEKSKENPITPMIRIGNQLEKQGVSAIAIPCITAHCFHKELANFINVPIIHIVKETASLLKENGVKIVGIAATDGAIATKLFQNELASVGIDTIIPKKKTQGYVTDLIYGNVKAGKPVDMNKFSVVSKELRQNGSEVIVLGCTELSLIKRDYTIGSGYVDAMEVLAKASILSCQGLLKSQYNDLITK
ncbi:amino acid racemase [Alkalibaculum sp. M08DMB]|uniref:Amino acid racemase n=1 Tax=Alkalibaculum sporogenes TaxID=2655001 RepID=A0A6A7KB37_9FIRM|nr:amino acid racemase [Alkalibaculum sporogenes]MPW26759.1 amino acid racemase [Alkalibaculum sporogenes]